MKRNVMVFGLISGVLVAIWVFCSASFCHVENSYAANMLLGYTAMLLALSFIFVAVKNYRDKENGGVISFGKAFQMGLYIALIASTLYVIAWAVDYNVFIPDFMDKLGAQELRQAYSAGATKAEIAQKTIEIASMKAQYANPVMFVLFTYAEILPVGLIVSLIAALILKRKATENSVAIA